VIDSQKTLFYIQDCRGLCYAEDAECARLNVLPQFKRLLEFGIPIDLPLIIDTAAEKMGFES
jgi:hypothetical protein